MFIVGAGLGPPSLPDPPLLNIRTGQKAGDPRVRPYQVKKYDREKSEWTKFYALT